MLVNVPKTLKGATLGSAHKWVRSHTSSVEYGLEDSNGTQVGLPDLTNGALKEVNIISMNPAHPAVFRDEGDFEPFGAKTYYGFNHNVNLTHILPEEVTPAMMTSMVRSEGLFGAVQSLSMLLNREVTEEAILTPGALAILSARTYGVDQPGVDSRLIRFNPTPYGIGRSYGGRILGSEIAQTDKSLIDWVEESLKDPNITADEATIDLFVKNVFTPYLLAAESNRRALQHINDYIMPELKGTEKIKKQYKYMAQQMATNPKDFYYGKQNAIIAHPGFLFPHFGIFSLHPSDKKRAKILLRDAGSPPQFVKEGTAFKQRSGGIGKWYETAEDIGYGPVEHLNMDVYSGSAPIDWQWIVDRIRHLDLSGIINNLFAEEIDVKTMDEPAAFVEAFKHISKKKKADFFKSVQDKPVLFIMDLPGMRPRPINWPDKLVMACMEVFAEHRAVLMGDDILNFGGNEFFDPILSAELPSIIEYESGGKTYKLDTNKGPEAWDDIMPKQPIWEVLEKTKKGTKSWILTMDGVTKETFSDKKKAHEKKDKEMLAATSPDYSSAMSRIDDAFKAAKKAAVMTTKISPGLTLVSLLSEAVSLSISKYQYEPDGDDIALAALIIVKSLESLDKSGFKQADTVTDKVLNAFENLRRKDQESLTSDIQALGKGAIKGETNQLAALIAIRRALQEN